MYEILKNSDAIRRKIKALFAKNTYKRRRVIVVAYIGMDPLDFISDPTGIEIVCCPKAGATNPFAISKLLKKNAQVRFADNLHMKLYWVEKKGVVVTSANLTKPGLGSGGNDEIGVFLPNTAVIDIDSIINSVKPRKISETPKILKKLYREHDLAIRRGIGNGGLGKQNKTPTFKEWCADPQRIWKMGWYNDLVDSGPSARSKEKAKTECGRTDIKYFEYCKKGQCGKGDWVLGFFVKEGTNSKNKQAVSIKVEKWIFIDLVVRTSSKDEGYDSKYPYEACQVGKRMGGSPPPFEIDGRFKKAFTKAANRYGWRKLEKVESLIPPKGFLKILEEEY